ncbi:MAG: glutathione S-transferase family protein [Pseudomonadota bacterium]
MADGRVVIGTKRYSSWSLRGWLMVRLAGLDVEEQVIPLTGSGPGSTAAIVDATPAGLVPYLEHQGARVWDSLSIAEYCAEFAPGIWPAERVARAHARSIAAEMHSSFRALRTAMPMNLGRDFSGRGRTPESLADIARIEAIWAECAPAPFLFGASFGAVDAMFAPVVARFITWAPELTPASQAYVAAVRAHPLVARWYAEAAAEPSAWLLDKYENPA